MITVDVCNTRGHSVSCKMQRKSCKSHVFCLFVFSHRDIQCGKYSHRIFNIFIDMPARTHTWSSSHFYSRYFTVNLRLKYVCNSLSLPPPPLRDFPVRQYVQAACDTEGNSISLCVCSFHEHNSDPSMKSTCVEPHMTW